MTRLLQGCIATTLCGLAVLAASTHSADSQARRANRDGDGYGTVTAHSRYGNPSRTARVRPGRFGRDVELGPGTWVHCEANDCAYTLRRQKVDFWETIREEGGGSNRN